jgi:L-aspartate oxidase
MKQILQDYYDVIVIGSGAAGLNCVRNLDTRYKILLITKQKLTDCDSYLAQGGISCLKGEQDREPYIKDTLTAGHYENNLRVVESVIDRSPKLIGDLIKIGVPFDKNSDGGYHLTREGGHSTNRIYHVGDYTGKSIVEYLINSLKNRRNLTIAEETQMTDIMVRDGSCNGILAYRRGELVTIFAKEVVLAVGGIGGIFPSSTNYPHIQGDGEALAIRHGLPIDNIEYIQIHPTAFFDGGKGRKFLISESVRGEGGILLNSKGSRFTDEMKPRDIVSAAVMKQMKEDGLPYVWLSFERIPKEEIFRHFPTIYRHCIENGIDITKEPIKVAPAQHYHMGGLAIDEYGETALEHLFAIGETACCGIHGKNRLASNSLLETMYYGEVAAKRINGRIQQHRSFFVPVPRTDAFDIERWNEQNRELVRKEIKRKDPKFYELWLENEYAAPCVGGVKGRH